jgi:hypothetical protein
MLVLFFARPFLATCACGYDWIVIFPSSHHCKEYDTAQPVASSRFSSHHEDNVGGIRTRAIHNLIQEDNTRLLQSVFLALVYCFVSISAFRSFCRSDECNG